MRLLTSRMSGMLLMVTGSLVSSVAQMTCRASFLAPCGVMVPLSGCPPSMMNDASSYPFLFFFPFFEGNSSAGTKRSKVKLLRLS